MGPDVSFSEKRKPPGRIELNRTYLRVISSDFLQQKEWCKEGLERPYYWASARFMLLQELQPIAVMRKRLMLCEN